MHVNLLIDQWKSSSICHSCKCKTWSCVHEKGLPNGCCMFDSVEVLAIACQQLLYGHGGFLMEQSCLFCLHCKKDSCVSHTPDQIDLRSWKHSKKFWWHDCTFLRQHVALLTVILLCHFFRGGLLSGAPSYLYQLLNDLLCGYSAVNGQEGIFKSLETIRKRIRCQ